MAVFLVRPTYEAFVSAGWGGRPGEGGAWGAVMGAGLDVLTSTLDMKLRLEGRRQHGGFRQGVFGPEYELARFQAAGAEGRPLADARFPDGHSLYAEADVGWDAMSYGGLQKHLQLSLGAEAFTWGRFEMDGRVAVQLFRRNLELAVKGLGVGMGSLKRATWARRKSGGASWAGSSTPWARVARSSFPKRKGRCDQGPSRPWAWGWTMRANSLLLLWVAVFSTGCASVSLAPRRSEGLRYMPRGASGPALVQPPQEERPHTWEASPPSTAGDALQRRLGACWSNGKNLLEA